MDNGLFSFADVKHGEWPAIVVLNPKPALTVQPSKEPYALVRNSTHIRLLIFSTTEISSCKVLRFPHQISVTEMRFFID